MESDFEYQPPTGPLPGLSFEMQTVAFLTTVSDEAASASAAGVVKLNNTVTSTSISEAATASVVKGLADRITALEARSALAGG